MTGSLFGADLPPGFLHRDDFISTDEEAELASHIERVEFGTFEMRGVVARRRVAFFGASYDRADSPSPPLSPCVMRLRPYVPPSKAAAQKTRRKTTHEVELLPRSAYVIRGEARSAFEHSIPEVGALRYSITLRTLR